MRVLISLFLTFSKIGLFSFGGGYSMLPMLRRELVARHGWITDDELTDYFSLGQCMPGLISGNTSVLVGYKVHGLFGGIVSVLGIISPSVVIILIVAAFISNFADYPAVSSAFAGIRVCVSVLIINTVIKLWKKSVTDKLSLAIFLLVFLLSSFFSFPAALLVAAAGIAGISISLVRRRMNK